MSRSTERRTSSSPAMLWVTAAGALALLLTLAVGTVAAQETTDTPTPTVGLEANERAPFPGVLFPMERAIRLVQRVELLEERLRLDVAACEETARLRLSLADETLRIESERYSSDLASLRAALLEANNRAERQWWEAPALWFGIGVALTVLVVVSIAAAL